MYRNHSSRPDFPSHPNRLNHQAPMDLSLDAQFRRLYDSTPAGQHPVLPIGRTNLLAPYVHTEVGRSLLSRPGEDVPVLQNSISARQIQQHRPSYINALLIQSRGVGLAQPCTNCRFLRGLRPFPECRHLPGAFGGACANCKWPDQASQCSVRDEHWHGVARSFAVGASGQQGQPARQIGHQQGDTASRPIDLDPEEGASGNPINLDGEGGSNAGNAIILDEEGTSEDPISL